MLIFEAIFDMLKNSVIGLGQLILIYIALNLPFAVLNSLSRVLVEFSYKDTIIGVLAIIISISYYGAMLKYMARIIGYLRLKSTIVTYIAILFMGVLFLISVNLYFAQYNGFEFELPTHKIALLDIGNLFLVTMYVATIVALAYRLLTRKYVHRNRYKEKTTEELKAVLSPAAMKVYEKKEDKSTAED